MLRETGQDYDMYSDSVSSTIRVRLVSAFEWILVSSLMYVKGSASARWVIKLNILEIMTKTFCRNYTHDQAVDQANETFGFVRLTLLLLR